MEWKAVYYNGLETNIEVTKCGKVKRVKKDWYGLHINSNNMKYDEIDFSKLKLGRGYKILTIQIKGMHRKSVYVHQLIASAFLGYNFKGHKNIVDHIDTDILNNNINNLRVITNRENTSKERTKKSGLPVGVSFYKPLKKYKSQIYINGKINHLGYFKTINEASYYYTNKLNEILKLQ